METLLSIAPFLEGCPDRSVLDFLAQQLRKGQLRMHRFASAEAVIFLGQENKLYVARVKTNSQTAEKKAKIKEVFSANGHRLCQLGGIKTHDVAALQLTGQPSAAVILNQLLEVFRFKPGEAGMASPVSFPFPVKVVQVACSDQHALYLTVNGRVLSSGSNNLGQRGLSHTSDTQTRDEVQLKTCSFATFVACGARHSIVICEQETVYAFGDNSEGQLGCAPGCTVMPVPSFGAPAGTTKPSYVAIPKLIGLHQPIKKACCGASHTLLLSSSDIVFGCGSGKKGQLGSNLTDIHRVTEITLPETVRGRILDIFAHAELDVSVLMDERGTLHISGAAGQLFGHSNFIPDFFPLKEPSVVLESRIVCVQPDMQRYAYPSRFNDASCCDVEVCTADKSEPIWFGWDTIRARSPYLTRMIENNMSEVYKMDDGKKRLTLRDYHWDTWFAYGKYLHENVLDAEPETLLELLDLAVLSDDDTGLSSLCANMLLRNINSENLCATLERCIEIRFHMLAVDLVKRAITVSNVCDILNIMARVEEATKKRPKENNNAKDEVDDLLIRYINDIGMAFAAQNAVAVVEGPKFAELNPIVAKDLLKWLSTRKLLIQNKCWWCTMFGKNTTHNHL
eukprot:Skav206317  [mRNA]  locus=scaffold1420:5707:7572:+ [translate_table: standard]